MAETSIVDKISVPFFGFQTETLFKRLLIVTHGGFIMETINAIRTRKSQSFRFVNDAKNTAIYILKIFCETCGNECSNLEKCRIYYDFLIYNDTSHLEYLIIDE